MPSFLCRNFQRLPAHHQYTQLCNRIHHPHIFARNHQRHSIFTCTQNNKLHAAPNKTYASVYYHSHRHISTMTIFCGGALLILLKKFIGLKFLQWYGWKRMYRLMHREGRKIMRDQPQRKQNAYKRLRTLHYKSMRKTFDFLAKHPTLISSVTQVDRTVTNALLYVPRKLKLKLHQWMHKELELQSKRRRNDPMFKLPKQWHGPLMLNEHGTVGIASIYLLSRYLWIAMHENHVWFNIAFVLSNREYIAVLNEEIQQRWKENPHEFERKQYVNILKKRL